MPAHSGSFVDHGAEETMALICSTQQQHTTHSNSYHDVDEGEDATTTAASNLPLSEMRRRAVLEELAIIDSDSNSSSSDSNVGGDDGGDMLEY